jgi:hypothetical protein
VKQQIKTLIASAVAIAALNACTIKMDSKEEDKNKKMKIQADSSMQSEEIALAGEQLIGAHSFMLADKVFDMALDKDSNNLRASFYKNLLKPMMIFKGIAVRIKPYVRTHGNINDLEKSINTFPNSSLKTFLLDGNEDIRDAKTIQDLLVDQRNAYNDFRTFLKSHQGMELTLNLNPYIFKETINNNMSEEACVVESNTNSRVSVHCDYVAIAQKKLNAADFVALQQSTAGIVLFYSLFYTSYSFEGLEELSKIDTSKMTYAEKLALSKQYPLFGKLRSDNSLKQVRELGADFSVAAKWAIQHQNLICPHGAESSKIQRKGFLFNKGICVTTNTESDKALDQLDRALAGTITHNYVSEDSGEQKSVVLSPFAMFDNPVSDLRQLAPTSVDACDHATELADPTLGGLFPNGDAVEHLKTKCNK